jgi:uncharacterized RDD family membrane protein YckC
MLFTIIGGDGREYGPVTVAQVRAWIASGRADEDTKAKVAGTTEWQRLGDFPELTGEEPPVIRAEVEDPAHPAPILAGRLVRLGATLIDILLGLICALPGGMLLGTNVLMGLMRGELPDDLHAGRLASAFVILAVGLCLLLILQTCLLTMRGQSLGKWMLGIRIVRYRDGALPGFVHAVLLRNWLMNVIGIIPLVGTVFPLVDLAFIFRADRRCLHDLIADTRVIAGHPPRE